MIKENKIKDIEEIVKEVLPPHDNIKPIDDFNKGYLRAIEVIEVNLRQTLLSQRKEVEEATFKNVGFLRQWLNEKPADRLVTNEDIMSWLKSNLPINS